MPETNAELTERLFATEPDSETEDDLAPSSPAAAETAVVTGTDWTAETILRQLDRGNIELNPRFQRRETWTDRRKSAFIESLILGLPIPQLVLAERTEQRGSYIVIDGKQRLIALKRFATQEDDENFKALRLSGLEVRKDLEGKSLSDLKDSEEHFEDVSAFENQAIRTMVVRAWPDEDFLYRVFLRLNTGSVPLSPQELRQALHPGPFVDFADDWSAGSEAIKSALGLDAPDFRMRDVELLIRFFGFAYFLEDYNGNLKQFLDETCLQLNERWAEEETQIKEIAEQGDAAIEATRQIFGGDAFRRFSIDGTEGRFNRAIFDVMTFYFRQPAIREDALKKSSDVRDSFKVLCATNQDFMESVTSTTKSIPATLTRLERWGLVLRGLLETEVAVPTLEANRIRL